MNFYLGIDYRLSFYLNVASDYPRSFFQLLGSGYRLLASKEQKLITSGFLLIFRRWEPTAKQILFFGYPSPLKLCTTIGFSSTYLLLASLFTAFNRWSSWNNKQRKSIWKPVLQTSCSRLLAAGCWLPYTNAKPTGSQSGLASHNPKAEANKKPKIILEANPTAIASGYWLPASSNHEKPNRKQEASF